MTVSSRTNRSSKLALLRSQDPPPSDIRMMAWIYQYHGGTLHTGKLRKQRPELLVCNVGSREPLLHVHVSKGCHAESRMDSCGHTLRSQVHQFKGSSASFGARQIAALCVHLREACQAQDRGRCQQLLVQLKQQFQVWTLCSMRRA